MNKTRVFIIDEVTIVREALASNLSEQADITIVGTARDEQEAVAIFHQCQPNVILLDLVSPHQDVLEVIQQLRNDSPTAKILVITSASNLEHVCQTIETGASVQILLDANWNNLPQAICAFANGQPFINSLEISQGVQKINITQPAPVKVNQPSLLTERETQTLRLIAKGLTNKDIGSTFLLKENTIAKYVSNILSKLFLTNRTQAALFAIQEGLDQG